MKYLVPAVKYIVNIYRKTLISPLNISNVACVKILLIIPVLNGILSQYEGSDEHYKCCLAEKNNEAILQQLLPQNKAIQHSSGTSYLDEEEEELR